MIQALMNLTSAWWLIFILIAVVASLALPITQYIINKININRELKRWRSLRTAIDSLSGCRIENLPLVKAKFSQELPELTGSVALLEQDSADVFSGLWVPLPESRLTYPESCAACVQNAVTMRYASTAGMTGLGLTVLAFVLAFVEAGQFDIDPLVRALAFIPLFIGVLFFLIFIDQRNRVQVAFERAHRNVMLAIERKVPIFSQAGETAEILNRFTEHDQLMLESVHKLSSRVDRMASGEITEAVTNSVKYLLSSTIGPPLQRSSEALAQLAFQLEKQMSSSLNMMGDRLIALEFQQNESAKFLQNQYETVTSTLLQQQEMSFKQLGAVQNLMLEQIRDQQMQALALMTSNQQQTLNALTEGQQQSYRTLSTEQRQSVQQMLTNIGEAMAVLVETNQNSQNTLAAQYQKAWSELQGGLSLTIASLVAGQEKLNGDWQSAQANLSSTLIDSQENLATSLQTNQVALLSQLTARQDELTNATLALTRDLSANLQEKLQQLTDSLASQQTQVAETLLKQQTQLVETLSTQQAGVTQALLAQQASVNESLLSQQTDVSHTLTAQQAQVDSSWKQWSAALAEQQAQIADMLSRTQSDMAAATGSMTKTVTDSLLGQQTALSMDLRARQDEFAHSLQQQQVELAKTMQGRQDDLLNAFQIRQAELIGTLNKSQDALYAATNELQERLHTAFQAQQLAAIDQMQQAQDQTLRIVAEAQQASLNSLTDDVAKNLGSYLDKYLEPVSARLIASADVLVAAQAYADKVQDAFELQREQVAIVEAGMKDAIRSFVETRTTMMQDLTDMRGSASVMSKSADKMSAIFSGSESGLSDSISELAGTMKVLKESLERITSGAVQNTKYLQEQIEESHRLNQQQISDLAGQITTFSDELATRIEQLTLGFSGVTEDMIKSVHNSLNEQNDAFSGNIRNLLNVLGEESRSMSLFAQEINSDIESLSTTLGASVANFNAEIRNELDQVLNHFDQDISDVLKRLTRATNELGDAIDALPAALAPIRRM